MLPQRFGKGSEAADPHDGIADIPRPLVGLKQELHRLPNLLLHGLSLLLLLRTLDARACLLLLLLRRHRGSLPVRTRACEADRENEESSGEEAS
jgi:hypothetical protein